MEIKKVTIKNIQTGTKREIAVPEHEYLLDNYDDFDIPAGEVVVSVHIFSDEIILNTWEFPLYVNSIKAKIAKLAKAAESVAA